MARLIGAVAIGLAAISREAHACPSCKEGLGQTEQWAQGFNLSILFMMSMPFAVVGLIGGIVYYNYRRRKQ